jgi:hypothetical protein
MGIIITGGGERETVRQRLANVIALGVAALLLVLGVNLRQSTLNATVVYSDIQAGIRAYYPRNWLLDTSGEYVFRVRDMSRLGYKTLLQISVQPVSRDTTERNIADRLALTRARTFTDYTVLTVEPYPLSDEITAQAVTYTFVSRDASPFLQGIPEVVIGQDVITINRGQALIITFRAEAQVYDMELARFRQFLATLEF